jgi:hypothetical protein
VAIPDIESFNRIWANNPLNIVSANEYEFYVDLDGAHVINNYSSLDGFWVGFIKASGVPFTVNSTDIPDEFFQYVAHAAYADFLRMDGQIEKAMAEEAGCPAIPNDRIGKGRDPEEQQLALPAHFNIHLTSIALIYG